MVSLRIEVNRTGEDTKIPLYLQRDDPNKIYTSDAANIINSFKKEDITYDNAVKAIDLLIAYMCQADLDYFIADVHERNKALKPVEITKEELERILGYKISIVDIIEGE